MSAASADEWQRREELLDELLALPADARPARLAAIERQSADDASALRAWLSGIARSADYLSAQAAQAPGVTVGAWRLERLLGRGGMGEVWLGARADGLFEKQVAIKFIRDGRASLRRSLESERRVLAGLQHPGIVRLLDAGTADDGDPYLVTDFIEGTTLDAWLAREPRPLASRLAVFRQIAAAVAYAHERLVVHRDIKPANVLVDAADDPHLLDFGIARALASGDADAAATLVALTPEYAAPELAADNVASVRSDIYALGGVLYFLLVGRPPLALGGLALVPLVEAIRTREPARIDAGADAALAAEPRHRIADLEAIARKALAKEPQRRYGSVDALLRDVDAALADLPVAARDGDTWDRLRRYLRRHRIALGAASALMLTLAAGLGGTLWQAQEARRQRDRAEAEAARASAEARTATVVRDFLVGVFEAGNPENTLGKAPNAIDLVDAAVRQAENALHDQPLLQAQLLAALGNTDAGLGRFEEAQGLLRRAHEMAVAAGAVPLASRRIAVDFARAVARGPGPYVEARTLIERNVGFGIADAANRELRELAIQEWSVLGELQRLVGDIDAAESNLRRAVAAADALGPEGERDAMEARYRLANVVENGGRRSEAIELMKAALATPYARRGEAAAKVNATRSELALMLGQNGRNDEAEAIQREVAASNRAIYGEGHPVYLQSQITLARLLVRKPAYAEAASVLEDARAGTQAHLGDDNEVMAQIQVTLAALNYARDEIALAIEQNGRALRYCLAHDGARSARVLKLRLNAMRMRIDDGEYAVAEREGHSLLADRTAFVSGPDSDLLQLLGDAHRYRGDAAGARDLQEQALDVLREKGDHEGFDMQDARLSLALSQRDLGDLRAARSLAQAAVDGLQSLGPGTNAKKIASARYLLAQIDVLEGRCAPSSLAAIEAEWQHESARRRFPMQEWQAAQAGLFLGLCRRGMDGMDDLVSKSADVLLASKLADPFSRRQARAASMHKSAGDHAGSPAR
ncbi:protein kinase domain-containing protein [Dokdonella sp.]|uniref:serine/threonine-protein kinase n=1 Tax=Dokdonella sp. TaxID=2291710 RepID=UPI00378307E3